MAKSCIVLFSSALFHGVSDLTAKASAVRRGASFFLSLRARTFATTTPTPNPEDTSSEDRSKLLQRGLIDPRTGERRKGTNWNYKAELSALAHRLGYTTETLPSLPTALTHRSVLPLLLEASGGGHNSRLSVVGHAVLVQYTRESLFRSYPNLDGAHLLDLSDSLTDAESLVKLAEYLGLPELMRTVYKLYSPTMTTLIGRALCAVIGCLYMDQGPQAAKKFLEDMILPPLKEKDLSELIKLQHPKYMLQQILKDSGNPPPVSRLIRESGRATHLPSFVVAVYSGNRCLGEGAGSSMKRAEEEAIKTALMKHFLKEICAAPLPSRDKEGFIPEKKINFYDSQRDKTAETAV